MKKLLNPQVIAFFTVLIVSLGGLAYMGVLQSENPVVFVSAPTKKVGTGDTIVIGGLEIGEPLGRDIESITGTQLNSFKDTYLRTQEGSTKYRQILRLTKTGTDGFTGGSIEHIRSSNDEVGDFLVFQKDEPAFEYEMVFNPGLESKMEDGEAVDLENIKLNILGKDYYIAKVEQDNYDLEIRFFGASQFNIKDNVHDNLYSKDVSVNGRKLDAEVKIRGTVSGSRLRIYSITYRFYPKDTLGSDVYVEPKHGITQYLREKQGMMHVGFNILYGGLQGNVVQQAIRRPRGSVVRFDPRGNDGYRLTFTNTRGQVYSVPLAELYGGSVRLGDGSRSFIVKEGSSSTDYNIDEGDFFVVSSSDKISATTNIIELDTLDVQNSRVFFTDYAGTQRIVNLDENGEGILPAGGANYRIKADMTNGDAIVVDQNNDGSFGGDRPKIVIYGGGMLEISGTSISFRTKARLFSEGGSDEVVSFNLVEDDGEINIVVPTQSELTLHQDANRLKKGLTDFGVYFQLDDDEPAQMLIEFPYGGQRSASVYGYSGQAKGYVVITLELDKFVK